MNTDEKLLTRARECKSPEDLIGLLRDEGVELDDEFLDEIAGGGALFNGERVAEILAKLGDHLQGALGNADLGARLQSLASSIMLSEPTGVDPFRL